VLKFVRTEVSLHINGANLKCDVTLPHRPTGRSFAPCTHAATASARAVADLSHPCHRDRPYMSVTCRGLCEQPRVTCRLHPK
jgi:hypothetical protein